MFEKWTGRFLIVLVVLALVGVSFLLGTQWNDQPFVFSGERYSMAQVTDLKGNELVLVGDAKTAEFFFIEKQPFVHPIFEDEHGHDGAIKAGKFSTQWIRSGKVWDAAEWVRFVDDKRKDHEKWKLLLNGPLRVYSETVSYSPRHVTHWVVGEGDSAVFETRQEAEALFRALQWNQNPATGNSYRLSHRVTWEQAEAQALELGGHLVTINENAEEAWLRVTFACVFDRNGAKVWTGFTDREEEGVWRWVAGDGGIWKESGTVGASYQNWLPGEPNGSIDQNGAAMMADGWIDLPADTLLRGIIESKAAKDSQG